MLQILGAIVKKIWLSWQPGARDLCTPDPQLQVTVIFYSILHQLGRPPILQHSVSAIFGTPSNTQDVI